MSLARLTFLYAAFAALATFANLGAQRLVLGAGGSEALPAAILAGTAVGLALKYMLDKRWIFRDSSSGIAAHGRRFALYTLMGVVTTATFWGTEYAFWILGDGDEMLRELGAVLGLTIGYVTKYRLDRRFVFDRPGAREPDDIDDFTSAPPLSGAART